jgi:ribosomal protein S18 acetylase RimI-like enzyme
MWKIRPVDHGDVSYLWRALEIAANWRGPSLTEITEVNEHPVTRLYVDGWGRSGDNGLLAEAAHGEFAGACWFRLFAVGEVWGAVEVDTPTLSLGVAREHRRRGLGASLLAGTLDLARNSGFRQVSLSVARDNVAAISLYEKFGFGVVNHAEGSLDMIASISGHD